MWISRLELPILTNNYRYPSYEDKSDIQIVTNTQIVTSWKTQRTCQFLVNPIYDLIILVVFEWNFLIVKLFI